VEDVPLEKRQHQWLGLFFIVLATIYQVGIKESLLLKREMGVFFIYALKILRCFMCHA
jgi:hypothetical protein